MKIVALLFSLGLLLVGFFTLGEVLLPQPALVWADLWPLVAIGAGVYLVLWLVGARLNHHLDTHLDGFIAGETDSLPPPVGLRLALGLLILTLLPFFMYLMAVSCLGAATMLVRGALAIESIGRPPMILMYSLLAGIASAVAAVIAAVIKAGIRMFRRHRPAYDGVVIPANQQRALWAMTARVATLVGTKPVDTIVISPTPDIGVMVEGGRLRRFLGGGRRVLFIGLPAIYHLTVAEFQAILAHEYGHFAYGDVSFSTVFDTIGGSLALAFDSTPGFEVNEPPSEDGRGFLVACLNPVTWSLILFSYLFRRVLPSFSRLREVQADVISLQYFGGQTFGRALLKVAMNGFVFHQVVMPELEEELIQEQRTVADFSRFMAQIYERTDLDKVKTAVLVFGSRHFATAYDSHPPLRSRLRYAKRYPPKSDKKELVQYIFEDWAKLNERVSERYNRDLLRHAWG